MEGGAVGHNFERDTHRDHLCQVWTLHRCFLPSLAPFGKAVSEEKIFLTLANQKIELILVAMFVGRMEPNEEALLRILHRCFLPSLAPFGKAVSEEKIFLNSSQSETRIGLGSHICWWNGTKWRNLIEDLT
jgi:hypothetical protein